MEFSPIPDRSWRASKQTSERKGTDDAVIRVISTAGSWVDLASASIFDGICDALYIGVMHAVE